MTTPTGVEPLGASETDTALSWDTSDYYAGDAADDDQYAAADAADLQQDAWATLCGFVSRWMDQLEDAGQNGSYWHVTVHNFGWRHTNGAGIVKAQDGPDLLRKVLPDTDCTFTVWLTDTTIEISNAHHDAPTGGERYTIRAAREEEITG